MTRRTTAVLLCAAFAAGIAACDDNGASGEADAAQQGIPVLASALQDSGTELGYGLTVAPGSWLIGGRFEHGGGSFSGIAVAGWSATLLLGEHPLDVLQTYVDQAVEEGFMVGMSHCEVERDAFVDEQRQIESYELTEVPSGLMDRLRCDVDLFRLRPEGGERPYEFLALSLRVGRPDHCVRPCEGGYDRYLTVDAISEVPPGYLFPFESAPEVGGLPLPKLVPVPAGLRLAEAGKRFGDEFEFFGGLVAEEGSAVVVPSADCGCGGPTGNFRTFLQITGDPKVVLEAYGRQFVDIIGEWASPFEVTERSVRGDNQFFGSTAESGGLSIDVVTTPVSGDAPVYARITVTND